MLAVRRYTALGAIDAATRLYRARFVPLVTLSLILSVPNLVLSATLVFLQRALDASEDDPMGALAALGAFCGVGGASMVVGLMAGVVGLGVATHVISAAALGREAGLREGWDHTVDVFGTLLGATLLVGLVVGAGMLCCLLPGIFAALALIFVGPVVVLERASAAQALARSWALARGRLGKLFLAMLVVALITYAIALGLGVVPTLIAPESLVVQLGASLVQVLATALVQPLTWTLAVLLYYDARVEQEAFDVAWLAAQAGLPAPTPEGTPNG